MKQISDKFKSLDRYKKKDEKVCKHYWQEEAKQICEKFNITGYYKSSIFKKAKTNLLFLKSKVNICEEKGIYNGRYLFALFRKQPMKEEVNNILLKELRGMYSNGDYYGIKRELKQKGWMLTPEKYSVIIKSLENIKPTETQTLVEKTFYDN